MSANSASDPVAQDLPSVFISYASPDRERVQPFCDHLKGEGFNVWIDHEQLKPGQNWDFEIRRALGHADFVLIFISNNSVTRRGYVQRELKVALDRLSEMLTDDIFIVPVLLDAEVTRPTELAHLHYVLASQADCRERIVDAIHEQQKKLGVARSNTSKPGLLSWNVTTQRDSWDGLPGYELSVQFIDVSSNKYVGVDDIARVVRGYFVEQVLEQRAIKFDQAPGRFHHAQDRGLRTNGYDVTCGRPSHVGDVLTIPYQISWYGAGAAHPNNGYKVFNFYLQPVSMLPSLKHLFEDSDAAFSIMQQESRSRLNEIKHEGVSIFDPKYLAEGTASWESFSIHGYVEDGIRLFFPNYQIGPYAVGSHVITIPFRSVLALMRPEFISAFSLEGLRYQMKYPPNPPAVNG